MAEAIQILERKVDDNYE